MHNSYSPYGNSLSAFQDFTGEHMLLTLNLLDDYIPYYEGEITLPTEAEVRMPYCGGVLHPRALSKINADRQLTKGTIANLGYVGFSTFDASKMDIETIEVQRPMW